MLIEQIIDCELSEPGLPGRTCTPTSGADLCWALGGIICNFTPILPYFQHWREWTSTTILFRCGNLVKTKRKVPTEQLFSPILGEDQKKKSSARIEHFFPQIYSQLYTHSNYWGRCRCGPFSNYWGGYSQIIGGIYPTHPPRVSALLTPATVFFPDQTKISKDIFEWNILLFTAKMLYETLQLTSPYLGQIT